MSTDTLAVVMRMVERSLIVSGGILSIFLGYRLFCLGIDKTQGEAVAFGISLKNFGPGLFFAALGAFVLITSMRASIKTGTPAELTPTAVAAPKTQASSTFFFGIEDPKRKLKTWSAKSFFIETRDFLRRLEQGSSEEELDMLRENLQEKLASITMSDKEYERYTELTNKIPLETDEERELSALEEKIFP